jgi:pilus assembly protein Flp/PilA
MKNILKKFRDDEDGAAMVEYSILIGLITAATITFIVGVGWYVTDAWSTLCTALGTGCTDHTGA